MDKFSEIKNDPIKEILKYVEMWEEKFSHYHFYNWELADLEKIERNIKELIEPYLGNEEVLLSMIKDHWKIMDFVNLKSRDPEFIYKAWMINPKSIIRGITAISDLESFIESHEFSPEVIAEIERRDKMLKGDKLSGNNEFARFMKIYNEKQLNKSQNQQQTVFYSLDGQTHSTMDEALMRNQEIQKEAASNMKL